MFTAGTAEGPRAEAGEQCRGRNVRKEWFGTELNPLLPSHWATLGAEVKELGMKMSLGKRKSGGMVNFLFCFSLSEAILMDNKY